MTNIAADDSAQRRNMTLVVAASSAGTMFEWYDFFIFGSLAAIIAHHFFSTAGETQGFIFALLTFAAGFAVRPLGALVFGRFGDLTGRKRTFIVTISVMGLATVAVGFLPDYNTIGVAAPYMLIGLRILQGFAIGGEYGGAAIYVAEHSRPGKRGAATGWIQVSASFGLLLALGVILVTRTIMGEDAFVAWGWRIPFLLSAVLLGISLWIRLKLDESPMFKKIQAAGKASKAPVSEAFLRWSNLKIVLLVLFAVLMGQGVVWYMAQFYTQFFLERVMKVEPAVVNALIMGITAAGAPLFLFFGWLSDRVGRKPVMAFGLALAAISYFPGFHMLTNAVNPALAQASHKAPVSVVANPADCSIQFDMIGKAKFVSSCDIAKSTLTGLGIPYNNEAAPKSGPAIVAIGSQTLESPEGTGLSGDALSHATAQFKTQLQTALTAAGYPARAETGKINIPLTLAILMVFVLAAAALYGPQAAALVELFPTRIRYTAMSVPYHVGVGWFGGFLPATAFAIVAATGNIYAGLWYPVIISGIGFILTAFFLPETHKRDLEA